jgi:formate hydrogenlyase subunit 6/NADH:ubiquinone oxidoreductase subunit I
LEISERDKRTCVRHRFRKASCEACAQACPMNCLDLSRGLRVDTQLCTNCGLCAAACPVQALPGSTRSLPETAFLLAGANQAILGCRSSSEGISTVRSACLGGLTGLDLVVLATSIQASPLRLNLAFCHQCPAGASVVPSVRRRIAEATVVLGENRLTALIDTRDAAMTPRQAMRRGFLRNILAPIAEAAQEFSSRQHEHIKAGELLSGIPERQKHVLEHRGKLPASSPSWLLSKTSGCDDCCRCVGVCPTGALSRQRKDGQRIFGIATERCTGCHACLDFCSKGGLALSRATAACEGGTAVHHEGSSTGDDLFCPDSETASESRNQA